MIRPIQAIQHWQRPYDGVGRHAGDSMVLNMKREGVTLGSVPWAVEPRRRRRAS